MASYSAGTAAGNGYRKRHRRRMLVVLVALLAMLAWLIWGMAVDLRSQPLTYHIRRAQPVNAYLCPGETLRYEVELSVVDVPASLDVVESWCEAKPDGVCNRATTSEYRLGALAPRQVYTLASRVLPLTDFFQAGERYELWHTTTIVTNAGTTVDGYVVGEIEIRDNCKTPEGDDGTN